MARIHDICSAFTEENREGVRDSPKRGSHVHRPGQLEVAAPSERQGLVRFRQRSTPGSPITANSAASTGTQPSGSTPGWYAGDRLFTTWQTIECIRFGQADDGDTSRVTEKTTDKPTTRILTLLVCVVQLLGKRGTGAEPEAKRDRAHSARRLAYDSVYVSSERSVKLRNRA